MQICAKVYFSLLLIILEPQCHVIFVQVPAHFEFIAKHNETSYSKPWLVAEPSSALIMPGEKCDVSIQVSYSVSFLDISYERPCISNQRMYEITMLVHLSG